MVTIIKANPRAEEWSTGLSIAWLKRASEFGVLGMHTHAEVTEVIGRPPDQPDSPVNVFTIVVLERRSDEVATKLSFLHGREQIELKSLPGWKFGVARYMVDLDRLFSALESFARDASWTLSGKPLRVGEMVPVAPQFVPPDGSEQITLNRLLKNNFWNGSYALEFFDNSKSSLAPFSEQPRRLQELSARVTERVPLELAGLADRLGNVVIQLPVTVLMNNFRKSVEAREFKVEVEWHPDAQARSLRAVSSMEYDGAFCSYGSAPLDSLSATVNSHDTSGANRHLLWDEDRQLILAATGPLYYIRHMSIATSVNGNNREPRTFSCVTDDKKLVPQQVVLRSAQGTGNPRPQDHYSYRAWTRKRIYKDEEARLEKERHFVQYRPDEIGGRESRAKAIDDIRYLINAHAKNGAWLWDPYLTAKDILDTLFHCLESDVQLRALTQGLVPREDSASVDAGLPLTAYFRRKAERQSQARAGRGGPIQKFVDDQRSILERAAGNCEGLFLEYRIRKGAAGFKFHDRFLIFPRQQEEPLAWSLGTSVNAVGKAHHILQRVDNGRLILEAFTKLWDQLDRPHQLIWKSP